MEWLYDKRVLDRNVQKGLITGKEIEKRLKSLPDLAEQVQAEPVPADEQEDTDEQEG